MRCGSTSPWGCAADVVPAGLSWDGYAAAWADLHGGVPLAGLPWLARGWLRLCYRVAVFLARLRVAPAGVTAAGLVLCLATPLPAVHPGGWPVLAGALVVLAAFADTVDGALAVVSGRTSRLGYLYDSLADRVGEAAWLLALYLVGVPLPVLLGCGGLAWLHEYARARAVAAGMAEVGSVTVAERPTRVVAVTAALLGAGLAGGFGPAGSGNGLGLGPAAGVATMVTVIWAVLGLVGAAQLLRAIHRHLARR